VLSVFKKNHSNQNNQINQSSDKKDKNEASLLAVRKAICAGNHR